MILFTLVWAAAVVFAAASAVRAVRYARAPLHLRWELYPVPEGQGGQLRAMVPEILFLKALWEHNRTMWLRSYPFHLGLYLTIAAVACLAGAAVTGWAALEMGFAVLAPAGAMLVVAGAVALLAARIGRGELKPYTAAGDIFNLVFFLVTFAVLLAGYHPPTAITFARALAAFDTELPVPPLFAAGMALAAVLMAYIPLTHMAHFIAKYFTYPAVRWDDRKTSAAMARRVAEYLTYRPTWSAPHVGADGKRTWAQIATTNPAAKKDA